MRSGLNSMDQSAVNRNRIVVIERFIIDEFPTG